VSFGGNFGDSKSGGKRFSKDHVNCCGRNGKEITASQIIEKTPIISPASFFLRKYRIIPVSNIIQNIISGMVRNLSTILSEVLDIGKY
jgi:hypothetical protein